MTLSLQEGRALLAKQKSGKRSKYGAKRCELDGIKFDSHAERDYYANLKRRERAGEVCDVELQRPFVLLAGAGKLVGTYKADFAFHDNLEGRWRVVDVKGFDTPLSRFKRKFVEALHGVKVEIVP
jgi:hypothetical protein